MAARILLDNQRVLFGKLQSCTKEAAFPHGLSKEQRELLWKDVVARFPKSTVDKTHGVILHNDWMDAPASAVEAHAKRKVRALDLAQRKKVAHAKAKQRRKEYKETRIAFCRQIIAKYTKTLNALTGVKTETAD